MLKLHLCIEGGGFTDLFVEKQLLLPEFQQAMKDYLNRPPLRRAFWERVNDPGSTRHDDHRKYVSHSAGLRNSALHLAEKGWVYDGLFQLVFAPEVLFI